MERLVITNKKKVLYPFFSFFRDLKFSLKIYDIRFSFFLGIICRLKEISWRAENKDSYKIRFLERELQNKYKNIDKSV